MAKGGPHKCTAIETFTFNECEPLSSAGTHSMANTAEDPSSHEKRLEKLKIFNDILDSGKPGISWGAKVNSSTNSKKKKKI